MHYVLARWVDVVKVDADAEGAEGATARAMADRYVVLSTHDDYAPADAAAARVAREQGITVIVAAFVRRHFPPAFAIQLGPEGNADGA